MKTFVTNAKKITAISFLLLMVPFVFFVSALLRQSLNLYIPPDTWLEKVGFDWLRIAMFAVIFILLPLVAVVLNLISLNNLRDSERKAGPNLPKGIKLINFIVVVVAGLVTFLFATVMLLD
jgi:hypothetical protein